MKGTVYIAGPMRGYEDYNFPMFDRATAFFEREGWIVISPAELDRLYEGWGAAPPWGWKGTKEDYRRFILRDIHAIIENCTAVAFLPGWEDSKGAKVERAIAEFFALEIIDLDPCDYARVDCFGNQT